MINFRKKLLALCIVLLMTFVSSINTGAEVVIKSIDKTAPKVNSTIPSSNAASVSVGNNITVKFSEAIAAGTNFSKIEVKNASGNTVPIAKKISGDTLIIDPNTNLSFNTKYTVTIPVASVKDTAGNMLGAQYSFNFTTAGSSTIIPSLEFYKTSYSRGSNVEMMLKLKGTKIGDKTNSVAYTIDYDGNTFELATGNVNNDIKAGYIPITTKNVIGAGANKKIVIMYTDMNNNTNLKEGSIVFSVTLKVKSNAVVGNKNFTLEPVSMLDSSFKIYNINNGKPINSTILIK